MALDPAPCSTMRSNSHVDSTGRLATLSANAPMTPSILTRPWSAADRRCRLHIAAACSSRSSASTVPCSPTAVASHTVAHPVKEPTSSTLPDGAARASMCSSRP
eukprot:scaffold2109_cov123-Isochrysis_galbana.AAC.23